MRHVECEEQRPAVPHRDRIVPLGLDEKDVPPEPAAALPRGPLVALGDLGDYSGGAIGGGVDPSESTRAVLKSPCKPAVASANKGP